MLIFGLYYSSKIICTKKLHWIQTCVNSFCYVRIESKSGQRQYDLERLFRTYGTPWDLCERMKLSLRVYGCYYPAVSDRQAKATVTANRCVKKKKYLSELNNLNFLSSFSVRFSTVICRCECFVLRRRRPRGCDAAFCVENRVRSSGCYER